MFIRFVEKILQEIKPYSTTLIIHQQVSMFKKQNLFSLLIPFQNSNEPNFVWEFPNLFKWGKVRFWSALQTPITPASSFHCNLCLYYCLCVFKNSILKARNTNTTNNPSNGYEVERIWINEVWQKWRWKPELVEMLLYNFWRLLSKLVKTHIAKPTM